MRRRWLRTNTLMLMALVACCAALLGVLKNQYDASPLQAALRGLRSGDAPVRREAVRALGTFQMEPDAVTSALIAMLHDPDEGVRSEAIVSLKLYGKGAAAGVPALGAMLREDHLVRFRRLAAEAIGDIGSPAGVPNLIEALGDEDQEVRQKAARSLEQVLWQAKSGESAVIPHLIARLERDSSEDVRLACLGSMIGIGSVGAAADQALVAQARVKAMCGDASAKVRSKAAVFSNARPSEIEVPALIAALEDPSLDVRVGASRSLARLGLADPRALPALCRAVRTSQEPRELVSWVHWLRMDIPPSYGPSPEAASIRAGLEAILSLFELKDVEVRRAALWPLFQFNTMARTTRDPAWQEASRIASRALLTMLADEREVSRVRVDVFGGFPHEWDQGEGEELFAALRKALATKDSAVRDRAVWLLVYAITWEPNPSVRTAWEPGPAERAAWRKMVPALMAVFKDHGMGPEPYPQVRGIWRKMVPVLGKAIEDPARDVRCGAARVLDELGVEARAPRVMSCGSSRATTRMPTSADSPRMPSNRSRLRRGSRILVPRCDGPPRRRWAGWAGVSAGRPGTDRRPRRSGWRRPRRGDRVARQDRPRCP